jgi:hypothetical protein
VKASQERPAGDVIDWEGHPLENLKYAIPEVTPSNKQRETLNLEDLIEPGNYL